MKLKKLNEVFDKKESPKAEQAIKLLLANPNFKTAVEVLRVKWGIYEKDPQKNQNLKKLSSLFPPPFKYSDDMDDVGNGDVEIYKHPESPYYKDLIQLMKRFRLDKISWMKTLWQYVRTGNYQKEDLYSESIPYVKLEKQEDTGMPKIVIEIGTRTTLKDVKSIWHRVEKFQKYFYGKRKFKLWKNFERDARIYSLYAEGKTIGEIWSQIKEEFKNQDLEYCNIKKIVSTFKKKFDIQNNRKLETKRKKT